MPVTPTPPPERFEPNTPTIAPVQKSLLPADSLCCGNCPAWKAMGPYIGECVAMMIAMGSPFYRSDTDTCSMPMPERTKRALARGFRR